MPPETRVGSGSGLGAACEQGQGQEQGPVPGPRTGTGTSPSLVSVPRSGPGARPLNVIALVSGGKDSFFSLLHCLANGHRVVALANLHPPGPSAGRRKADAPDGPHSCEDPEREGEREGEEEEEEATDTDLNSFMYQTVGHQVIPLYADATGIPLFRAAIVGGAVQTARDYYAPPPPSTTSQSIPPHATTAGSSISAEGDDETESMTALLHTVLAAHPTADAVSAGAILSTYQRTRVESVAVRLGLVPLAFLWKYPLLPLPLPPLEAKNEDDGAQLLRDMAAAGLEARVVKVASGGLDESFLWEDVASEGAGARVGRAMRRFGVPSEGAVLGEGGEFETLVVDGPRCLFRKGRVVVGDEDRVVVREGGGTAWLNIRRARLELKKVAGVEEESGGYAESLAAGEEAAAAIVRVPDLLDRRFAVALGNSLSKQPDTQAGDVDSRMDWKPPGLLPSTLSSSQLQQRTIRSRLEQWTFISDAASQEQPPPSVSEETRDVVGQIRRRLAEHGLEPTNIASAVVVLRRMADFPVINGIYGGLFTAPNPPSRVTISCGDRLLPRGCSISVSLSVDTGAGGERQGLHVQSRSYWAPANIGPYSQAVSIPISSSLVADSPPLLPPPEQEQTVGEGDDGENDEAESSSSSPSPRLVFIAGQIPLVPATMDLPPPPIPSESELSPSSFALQATLALQHLWRIGAEMRVQWWSSAVAYVPRANVNNSMNVALQAQIAGNVWGEAHRLAADGKDDLEGEEKADDDDDKDGGPDLWDRKYNAAFMTFGDAKETRMQAPPLPDREAVGQSLMRVPPPFFLAEVEELPRQAGVEWHAHIGFSGLSPKSVRCVSSGVDLTSTLAGDEDTAKMGAAVAHQTTVLGRDGVSFAHSVVSVRASPTSRVEQPLDLDFLLDRLDRVLNHPRQDSQGSGGELEASPYLLYVNSSVITSPTWRRPSTRPGIAIDEPYPLISCASLWDSRGESVAVVALYRETTRTK